MNKKEERWYVEVWYNPGVTDAVGESAIKGIADLGVEGVKTVKTAQKYLIEGKLSREDVEKICTRLLANAVIQNYKIEKG